MFQTLALLLRTKEFWNAKNRLSYLHYFKLGDKVKINSIPQEKKGQLSITLLKDGQ